MGGAPSEFPPPARTVLPEVPVQTPFLATQPGPRRQGSAVTMATGWAGTRPGDATSGRAVCGPHQRWPGN